MKSDQRRPADPDEQQTATTVQHLLDVVSDNRDRHCAELLQQADDEAREIVGQAHARSRARMRRHIGSLREKYRVQMTAAIARNQTLLRRQHQQTDRNALDAAWPRLHHTLRRLWQDPASRRHWAGAAITTAASQLLERNWRIQHPRGFDPQELQGLLQPPDDDDTHQTTFSADDDIDAGLRISAGGTVLDATVDGLLRQQTAIESRLLAGIRRLASEHSSDD